MELPKSFYELGVCWGYVLLVIGNLLKAGIGQLSLLFDSVLVNLISSPNNISHSLLAWSFEERFILSS